MVQVMAYLELHNVWFHLITLTKALSPLVGHSRIASGQSPMDIHGTIYSSSSDSGITHTSRCSTAMVFTDLFSSMVPLVPIGTPISAPSLLTTGTMKVPLSNFTPNKHKAPELQVLSPVSSM